MKQTAIDYLIEQMNIQGFFGVYCTEDKIDENRKLMTKIIEQAKAMHKEEMIQNCAKMQIIDDVDFDGNVTFIFDPEQYYNKTYGGNK